MKGILKQAFSVALLLSAVTSFASQPEVVLMPEGLTVKVVPNPTRTQKLKASVNSGFTTAKQTVGNAYESTKQTVGNAKETAVTTTPKDVVSTVVPVVTSAAQTAYNSSPRDAYNRAVLTVNQNKYTKGAAALAGAGLVGYVGFKAYRHFNPVIGEAVPSLPFYGPQEKPEVFFGPENRPSLLNRTKASISNAAGVVAYDWIATPAVNAYGKVVGLFKSKPFNHELAQRETNMGDFITPAYIAQYKHDTTPKVVVSTVAPAIVATPVVAVANSNVAPKLSRAQQSEKNAADRIKARLAAGLQANGRPKRA